MLATLTALATSLVTTSALPNPNPRVLALAESADAPAVRWFVAQGKEAGFTVTVSPSAKIPNLPAFDVIANLDRKTLSIENGRLLSDFVAAGGGHVALGEAAGASPAIQRSDGISWQQAAIGDRFHPSSVFLPVSSVKPADSYPPMPVRVLMWEGNLPIAFCSPPNDEVTPGIWRGRRGRDWVTTLGAYGDPHFARMVREGVLWAAQGRPAKGSEPATWFDTTGWALSNSLVSNSGSGPIPLRSKQEHGDALIHIEFRIPKGSNSGVYLQGRYELQIFDSFGKPTRDLSFSDCGGIYERWTDPNGPGYEGIAPSKNAFRGPDTWNEFDILFRAPRFAKGKKVENAQFVEVRLNGVVIHRNLSLNGMTRGPFFEAEGPIGPIILQGDHGPVSFRKVWIKPVGL